MPCLLAIVNACLPLKTTEFLQAVREIEGATGVELQTWARWVGPLEEIMKQEGVLVPAKKKGARGERDRRQEVGN